MHGGEFASRTEVSIASESDSDAWGLSTVEAWSSHSKGGRHRCPLRLVATIMYV